MKPAERRYLVDGSNARGLGREKRGDEPMGLLKGRYCGANAGQAPVGLNIEGLFYANAALFFLGRLLRWIVQILLLVVNRNKRFRNSAPDKVSSNQLVPSTEKERLR